MFDLARQLHALHQQVSLFTGYPRLKIDNDLRPLAATHPLWVVLEHLRYRLPGTPSWWWPARTLCDFGKWLGRAVEKESLDVLDALDGGGLEAGRIVRKRGGLWVCNRGSAHVLTQKQLLTEEHRHWGIAMPRDYFPPPVVERCLLEYDEAEAIVVPSHFARRSFVSQGLPERKVFVAPYGVDLSLFKPQPKEDKRFRILFVGTQSVQKGIGYLLEAVEPLVRSGSVELWLVGHTRPEAKTILDRYAGLFRNMGPHPRSRLAWFYSQGSVLVLPSVQEGLALVQAQAMACGVPVISTTNTGAEDLFSNGVEGFIVPPRDASALRERIQWMLDNPDTRTEMGAAAMQRVQTLGGWLQYGERCLNLYQFMLRQRSQSVVVPAKAEPVTVPFGQPGCLGAR